jgi:hypothetical protein
LEEEKAEKMLEVEKMEKKVQEAEEYQQHMEQEQSDGQVALFLMFMVSECLQC